MSKEIPIENKKAGIFKRIGDYFRFPGRQFIVQSAAPTQFVNCKNKITERISIIGAVILPNTFIYSEEDKKTWGSRFFNCITDFAGSRVTFVLTVLVLIAWAIAGGILGARDNWQIAMQDGSSIQVYISDTLLMRQQHNHSNRLLTIISQLRSRNTTFNRLLKYLLNNNDKKTTSKEESNCFAENMMPEVDKVGDAVELPTENIFDTCCNYASVGSLYAQLFIVVESLLGLV
jgi:low-affinity ferrous iron transport protein